MINECAIMRNNSDFEQLAIVWNAVDRLGK